MLKIIYFNTFLGHLAIAFTGLGKKENCYISYYHRSALSQFGCRLQNLVQDGINQIRNNPSPDESEGIYKIVELPTEETHQIGLSERAMHDWWKSEFDPEKKPYKLFTHNCSSVVYNLLCVGQSESASLKHLVLPLNAWERPGTVSAYAEAVKQSIFKQFKLTPEKLIPLTGAQPFNKNDAVYFLLNELALRLRDFKNLNEHHVMIIKPFCVFVKKALREFNRMLPQQEETVSVQVLRWYARSYDLPLINLEEHLKRLFELIQIVSKYAEENLHQTENRALQRIIKVLILERMDRLLGLFTQPAIVDKKQILSELAIIRKKVVDQNNPHADQYQTGTKGIIPRFC